MVVSCRCLEVLRDVNRGAFSVVIILHSVGV